MGDYANSVCVFVPRDWFYGPISLTHLAPTMFLKDYIEGIYVLRGACHMPSVFGRVDMWAMGQ